MNNLRNLTLVHLIRIPVEITLYGLYLHHGVPRSMTVEGGNLDILSGLSAPVMYFVAASRPRLLFWWNIVCLALLLNVAGHGVHAIATGTAPSLRRFPYILIPTVAVPTVLVAHVYAIWRLFPRKLAANAA